MVKPTASPQLFYENDTLSISFTFNTEYLGFELYNKSDEGIRINWDEVSAAINGYAKRIVHFNTSASKILEAQPPSTVPPHSKLEDGFIIADNVSTAKYGGSASVHITDIYPDKDYGDPLLKKKILALKGQRTSIYFPYYIRNSFYAKTFEFVIENVSKKSK